MKDTRFRRFIFVACVCALSVPWLTPCGVTAIPAIVLQVTDQSLQMAKGDPIIATSSQWKSIEGKPGMKFVVRENQAISRSSLIAGSEWTQAGLPTNGHVETLGGRNVEKIARLLYEMDPGNHMQQKGKTESVRDHEQTKKMVVCRTPLVLLEADRLRFTRTSSRELPVMVEASTETMMAKATINTAEGNLFASAQRICYRASKHELILEGNATVLSGRRQINTSRPWALIRLQLAASTVMVDVQGAAVESPF